MSPSTSAARSRRRRKLRAPVVGQPNELWWDTLDGLRNDTPILTSRPLEPGAKVETFGDDRWTLTPALLQEHAAALSIDWRKFDVEMRGHMKTYAWVLFNYVPNEHDLAHGYSRLAIATVAGAVSNLRPFTAFLHELGRASPSEATAGDLDEYAKIVASMNASDGTKLNLLVEIRRLWAHRGILGQKLKLPERPPWLGESPSEVLGVETRRASDNKTERIPVRTMDSLLGWSLRFLDCFAEDVLEASVEYNRLAPMRSKKVPRGSHSTTSLKARTEELVNIYRDIKRPLPGKTTKQGLQPHASHLARLLDAEPQNIRTTPIQKVLMESGLPIVGCAAVMGMPTGQIDGKPWLELPIDYDEVESLVDALTAACLILVAYLSGMRSGEVLNLRRDCVRHDEKTGLWTVVGRTFKGERDEFGHKAGGTEREVPWVVVEPVAKAVMIMQRLHESPLIFPTYRLDVHQRGRQGKAMRDNHAARVIRRFTHWVNAYCKKTGRLDAIPEENSARGIRLGRFRRTLAWHIYRKPRGLVGAAIQYGHVSTTMLLGYAGNAESGFPDELAFERFLAKLDQLVDNERRLEAGERVSGPSAQVYRERVPAASIKFQGVVLTSGRQARALLNNDELQIHEGRGMTCVPQLGKQLCQTRREPGLEDTPDLADCRRGCQCKAYTDRDIEVVHGRIKELQHAVDDSLAPPLRVQRENRELQRLLAVVAEHSKPEQEPLS